MGRLDRNNCDICNKLLPSMGYIKVADGNICMACSKKISPLLKNRKEKTVEYLKRHIKYRDDNRIKLNGFKPSIGFGYDKKIYIDPYMSGFVVSGKKEEEIAFDNPDIISLSQVKSCETKIREYVKEEFTKDEDGKKVSFFPKRFINYYDFITTIILDNEWFDRIVIDLNGGSVEGRGSIRYEKCSSIAKQLKDSLLIDNSRVARNSFAAAQFRDNRDNNHAFSL